uniref:Uncharacterized protein n=1 Tax=viral metagenome TaxID=1070528 RepID=A0A6H1ZXU8_9ZZZZ
MSLQVDFEILVMLNTAILFTIAFLLSKELRTRLILGSINIVTWFALSLAFVASQPSFPVFAMVFFAVGLIFTITLIHESISMFKEKRWKTEMD